MLQKDSSTSYPCLDTVVPFGPKPPAEGMVLLAVDESSIGRMLIRVFSKAGLRVLWARNLSDTLGWLDEYRAEIGLAFLDCSQSDGETLAFCHQARAICPGLPVVHAVGPRISAGSDGIEAHRATIRVAKPYLPTELAWNLRAHIRRIPSRGA
jgi:DNA-binding response OmpR family regulator